MTKTLVVAAALCFFSGFADAQSWSGIITSGRAVDWSNVGISGGIPSRTTVCATLNPGATAAQINSAISSCPSGQVVYLNAGTYNLTDGIDFNGKSNVTLRGAGADQTFLVFNNAAVSCHGLWSNICIDSGDTSWPGGPSNSATWSGSGPWPAGTTQITLSSVANLAIGSPIVLDQLNDSSDSGSIFVCDSVAANCNDDGPSGGPSGGQRDSRDQEQLVTVTAINGNTITFSPGLYMPNWRASQSPGAWWSSNPITADGVENLSVDHTASTETSGTAINNCVGCWISGIRSMNSNRSHVWSVTSLRTVVRDSYFYGTKNASSQSYGVECYPGSDLLIENNIFQHITTPQMVNAACSGSVIAYNYSINDYYNDSPGWMQQNVSLHAGGIDNLLIEGNVGAGLWSDLFHGSHHFVTAFRNRFNGFETGKTDHLIPFALWPFSRYFNAVGNVLGQTSQQNTYQVDTSSGSGTPIYAIGVGTVNVETAGDSVTGSTFMRWGNYDTFSGTVKWNSAEVPSGIAQYANSVPSDHNLPASFYRTSKPTWWPSTKAWPPIGPDVSGGNIPNVAGHAYTIPAQDCYLSTMGGPTDGSGSALSFNANTCYAQSASSTPVTITGSAVFGGKLVLN